MNLPTDYYQSFDKNYEEYIKAYKFKAFEVEKKFLNNSEEYHLDKFLNNKFILLSTIYPSVMFCPTVEIISKLKADYNLSDQVLDWFIQIEKIDAEFEKIKAKGIAINKMAFLQMLFFHMIIKFNHYLLLFFEYAGKEGNNGIESAINSSKGYLKRSEYHKKKGSAKKSDFDKNMDKYYGNVAKLFNGDGDGNQVIKNGIEAIKGKTQYNIIKPMVEVCFQYEDQDQVSQINFLDAVYDLFRIVLQDTYLPNEIEFNERFNHLPESYRRWRTQRLRRYIL